MTIDYTKIQVTCERCNKTHKQDTICNCINERLEYLRGELRAERLSYGELAELQDLKDYIDSGDTELLEAAGVPEFEDDKTYKIVRFYQDDSHPDHRKVIKTGLTLEEAQDHCNDEDTHEPGVWFDGYTEE